ncbi:hypothetical protein B0A52_08132 [Exophiala mesophila]|uniref:GRIP domain-containing protein n=1 Tax=Exophiala mesophila TaxID=212818 RepID=A0A438MXC7_EXOME|nr:hypothetical protein B0A52_08132 [Exophiala mesophila]
MFQRLKGAIDSRIAEEQARQRQAQSTTQPGARNPARRRTPSQNANSDRRPSRQRQPLPSTSGPLEKGPDPSEFEPEFTVGDDDSAVPSRVATPKPESSDTKANDIGVEKGGQGNPKAQNEAVQDPPGVASQGDKSSEQSTVHAPSPRSPELPTEVRVKLRKLERMESKYAELLKAYRTAHARVQTVDSFEASLRENTPLTSISDAGAFVEYLSQLNLKTDMVLEELKRVTTDRDHVKKKLKASEEDAAKLRDEVEDLKSRPSVVAGDHTQVEEPANNTASDAVSTPEPVKDASAEDAVVKSPTSASSRLASFSLFSPRSKPLSPPTQETSEDFFSFDSEHARLEAELQERIAEVDGLKDQNSKLQGDLKVARESTEGMVQSLETATRELIELREARDKFNASETDLRLQIQSLETKMKTSGDSNDNLKTEIQNLTGQKDELSQKIEALQLQIHQRDAERATLQEKLESNIKDANILNEKLSQKDSVVKDLEDTIAAYKLAEREQANKKTDNQSNGKKLATMQNLIDTLRSQLTNAEATITNLKTEMQTNIDDFSNRPSTKILGFLDEDNRSGLEQLNSRDDVVKYLQTNFGLQKPHDAKSTIAAPTLTPSPAPSEAGASASKKKNKKKKKGKGPQTAADEPEADVPIKVSENLAEIDSTSAGTKKEESANLGQLETEIRHLREELSTKETTIERLSKKLKDQEELQEEIETLRDDLLHQGQEHVEARDALKTAQTERSVLEQKLESVEKELSEARKAIATGADSDKAHKALIEEHDDLRAKSFTMEKDLAAAEQLATARFKDITDLKELLAKAQPELRNLRNEVAELKVAKDDLKNKTGELNRLEARHEDIKSELKGLAKRLSDKDSEIKVLQQKIEQETAARARIEKELDQAQADARAAETKRQEAASNSEFLSKDLEKAKGESQALKTKLRDLEEQLSNHTRTVTSLQEEITLKAALHSSTQSIVQSLRDQTHELNMQARESSTRADSLEEELNEAQRMLTERTREGQTMRMLLDQSETGTEARIREMKERMDAALEERDRVEDEASVSSRRMMREVEEARSKARDAQRALKVLEDEKDELETRQREWKKRRDELEQTAVRASKEVEEVRAAMSRLREALDESERQVRDLDTQKSELRKSSDEAKERVDKLTKANKNLTDELKALQSGAKNLRLPGRPNTGLDSGVPSSRTSIDSSHNARSPAPKEVSGSLGPSRSETPTKVGTQGVGLSQGSVDYVYLKNVLLQFMEQRDKGHQRQLIPVLGMLLHFDRKDEQKWLSAISARS